MKTKLFAASLVLLVGCFVTGCSTVDNRKVKVNPYTLPATAVEKKFPISAALVLDKDFKSYVIKKEQESMVRLAKVTAAYHVGPHIERYAREVITDQFRSVSIFASVIEAAEKCDVIILPKAVRSSTNDRGPIQVMLVIEWHVMDRDGQNLIWLTSVESQSSVKLFPKTYFSAIREAYTIVLSDLSAKTIDAFQTSPEIRAISDQRR